VARGEYLVAAAPSELQANGLKSKGLSFELVRAEQFKEGSYLTAGFGSVVLIQRAPHPTDGRQVLLSATAVGREVLLEARRAKAEWLTRRLTGLSAPDREVLAQAAEILDRIARETD